MEWAVAITPHPTHRSDLLYSRHSTAPDFLKTRKRYDVECTAWQCRFSIVHRLVAVPTNWKLFLVPAIFLLIALAWTLYTGWPQKSSHYKLLLFGMFVICTKTATKPIASFT